MVTRGSWDGVVDRRQGVSDGMHASGTAAAAFRPPETVWAHQPQAPDLFLTRSHCRASVSIGFVSAMAHVMPDTRPRCAWPGPAARTDHATPDRRWSGSTVRSLTPGIVGCLPSMAIPPITAPSVLVARSTNWSLHELATGAPELPPSRGPGNSYPAYTSTRVPSRRSSPSASGGRAAPALDRVLDVAPPLGKTWCGPGARADQRGPMSASSPATAHAGLRCTTRPATAAAAGSARYTHPPTDRSRAGEHHGPAGEPLGSGDEPGAHRAGAPCIGVRSGPGWLRARPAAQVGHRLHLTGQTGDEAVAAQVSSGHPVATSSR